MPRRTRYCPDKRSSMEGVRRPTAAAAPGAAGGGGSDVDKFSAAASPRSLRGNAPGPSMPSTPEGSRHPSSSPPSPLLAYRGVLKRPSSGGLPVRLKASSLGGEGG